MNTPVEFRTDWEKWTSTRPHFQLLHGRNLHWTRNVEETLVSLPVLVLIVGPFGVGKSFLFGQLEDVCKKHTKATSRCRRYEERNSLLPYRQCSCRQMFYSRRNQYVSMIMGLDWPYPEWTYWGKKFGIKPPSANCLWRRPRIVEELTSCFPVNSFIHALQRNSEEDISLGLELSPVHLFDWLNLLETLVKDKELLYEKVRIIAVQSSPEVVVERLIERWRRNKRNDPSGVIKRARILESLATPTDFPLPARYRKLRLKNDFASLEESSRMIKRVRKFVSSE